MRLAKFLAHSGVASRRAAERLIAAGRVSVGGHPVTDPARDVDESSDVRVDGETVAPEELEVHLLHKPAGVVSTAADTHGRRTVVEFVASRRRLYPVGRLDADTTGLILLTNDGTLAERLTHPRYGVEKVYRASVRPADISDEAVSRLRAGVTLDEGRTSPAEVSVLGPGLMEITIGEGRKRQVRRMCEAVGYKVSSLERVRFGPLTLGGLPEGESRALSPVEVAELYAAAGWDDPAP